MKNLKTTASGAAGGIALIATGVQFCLNDDYAKGVPMILSGLGIMAGLFYAADKGPKGE